MLLDCRDQGSRFATISLVRVIEREQRRGYKSDDEKTSDEAMASVRCGEAIPLEAFRAILQPL
jgi:hypothetical protein